MVTSRKVFLSKVAALLGPQFDFQHSADAGGYVELLFGNIVNIGVPCGASQCDLLYKMAESALRPTPIKSIYEALNSTRYPKGNTVFGNIGNEIKIIVAGHPTLRWWMEVEGLVIAKHLPELSRILAFDRRAGFLVSEHWTDNRLSQASLLEIAAVGQIGRNSLKFRTLWRCSETRANLSPRPNSREQGKIQGNSVFQRFFCANFSVTSAFIYSIQESWCDCIRKHHESRNREFSATEQGISTVVEGRTREKNL